jgi:hypothetical protein
VRDLTVAVVEYRFNRVTQNRYSGTTTLEGLPLVRLTRVV